MKKILWIGLSLALLPTFVFAAEFRAGNQTSLKESDRVVDNLYMVGGSVASAGTVVRDLFVGGGSVLVSGAVGGDLAAVGGNLTVTGTVGDDLRAAGGNIIVQSQIGGDALVAGGQIILSGPRIVRDAVIAGGVATVDAPVGGDLEFHGGEITINAPVVGNARIDAKRVTLGEHAVIGGDFTYTAETEAVMEEGARVVGKTTYTPRTQTNNVSPAAIAALLSFFAVVKFLMLFVSALVVGLLLRRYSRSVLENIVARPFNELGRGIVTLIVLPVLSVLLLITVVGIPFGIMGLLGFVAVMIASCIIAPIVLGAFIYHSVFKRGFEISWHSILVGALVYTVLGWIPILGWLATFLLMLLVLGAMTEIKLGVLRDWR